MDFKDEFAKELGERAERRRITEIDRLNKRVQDLEDRRTVDIGVMISQAERILELEAWQERAISRDRGR